MNNVYLNKADGYDIRSLSSIIEQNLSDMHFFDLLKPKMKVLLLPTLTKPIAPDFALTTHPNIICAIANVLNKCGVECSVAGSPYGKFDLQNLDKTYLETGMIDAENLSKVKLNHDLKTSNIKFEDGVKIKNLTLLNVVNDVDVIININKLVFDKHVGYMGAVSNMFNLIPGELKTVYFNRLTTIEDYYNFSIDLYCALKDKIKLNITDAIVSREQDSERMVSCLAISKSALAIDRCFTEMFAIDENESIIKVAEGRGLIDNRSNKYQGYKPQDFSVEDYLTGEWTLKTVVTNFVAKPKSYFKSHQECVVIDPNKCKGCETCTKICPSGAISIKYDKFDERYAEIDYQKCIFCNKCHTACPYGVVDVRVPQKSKALKKEINKFND